MPSTTTRTIPKNHSRWIRVQTTPTERKSVAIASKWRSIVLFLQFQQDPSPPDLQVTHEIGPAGRVPQQRNIREEGKAETPPGTFRGRHWAGFMTVFGQKQAIDALTERQAA